MSCTPECTSPCDWDALLAKRVRELIDIDSVIIDIGSHVGRFITGLQNEEVDYKAVVAIEPDPDNFSTLTRAHEADNAYFVNAAVSDEQGTVTLYEGTGDPATYNIMGSDAHIAQRLTKNHIEKGTVICTTLDFIADRLEHKLDVCKIDVEGAETKVIRGGIKTLNKMQWVFVEVHNPDTYKEIFDIARENGWTLLCLKNLHEITEYNDNDFCYQVVIKI